MLAATFLQRLFFVKLVKSSAERKVRFGKTLLLRVGVEDSKKNPKVLSVLSDPSCLCFFVHVCVTAGSLISTGG